MKKFSILMIILVISLLLSACGSIEDMNGEETSLSQITTEEFYGNNLSWSASNTKKKSSVSHDRIIPSNYYAPQGFTEELDKDFYSLQCGSGSGITNLIAIRLEAGESVTIDIDSQIDQGNLEIILLKKGDGSNTLIHQFETGRPTSFEITADSFGIYLVRAGVESFAGSIEINRSFNQ